MISDSDGFKMTKKVVVISKRKHEIWGLNANGLALCECAIVGTEVSKIIIHMIDAVINKSLPC